eukprot:6192281-Pleurochrysis_carterae.AAC.1
MYQVTLLSNWRWSAGRDYAAQLRSTYGEHLGPDWTAAGQGVVGHVMTVQSWRTNCYAKCSQRPGSNIAKLLHPLVNSYAIPSTTFRLLSGSHQYSSVEKY